MAAIETLETGRLVALVLSEAERDALVRVLYVVKDNFWLDDVEELSELVKDGFLPIVESVPGFVGYYVVEAGDGVASSITICEDKTAPTSPLHGRPRGSRSTRSTSSSPARQSSPGP